MFSKFKCFYLLYIAILENYIIEVLSIKTLSPIKKQSNVFFSLFLKVLYICISGILIIIGLFGLYLL